MSGQTVRFIGEFDDTKLIEGVRRATSTIASLSSTKQITLFGPEVLQDLDKLEQSTNALEQSFTGLDSASTGISGSFDEIGNAANQAGDNFNTLGTSGATIEQQLAEIGTTSVTAGQSMSALGGSADTTGQSMGALQSNFEGVSGGLTDTNTLFGETTGAMADVDDQAQTTGERMQKIWSKGSGIAIGISATISGIANLVRGFRDYDDAQNRVAKANLAVTKAQEKATGAQAAYNEAVAAYGKNSAEAESALADLGKANDNLGIKQTNLSIATKRAGDAQTDIWLGLAGTVTGIGGSIIQSLDAIGGQKGFTGLIGKMKGIPGAMAGVAGAIGGVNLAAGTLFKTLGAIGLIAAGFEIIGRAWAGALESGNPFFTKIHEIGLELEKIPVIGPALKIFGAIMNSIFLPDLVAKENEEVKNLSGGIDMAATSVKSLTTTVKDYVPTSQLFITSTRQIGPTTKESYTMAGKAIHFYGLEQQTTAKTSQIATAGFKALAGGVSATSKEIAPNTKLLNSSGIALFDVSKATVSTNKAVSGSTDVYSEWINKGVDPANQIIQELSASVRSGVIPQNQLGKAVELSTAKLEASGTVTEANKEQVVQLATAHLDDLFPALKQTTKATMDDVAIMQEYAQETAKVRDLQKQRADEIKDLVHQEELLNKVGITRQDIMSHDVGTYTNLTKVVADATEGYKSEEESLTKVLVVHGKLGPKLGELVDKEGDQTDQLRDAIIQSNLWTDALDGNVNGVDLVKKGTADAVIEMANFVEQAVISEAKTKKMNEMYAQLGQTMVGKLHTTVPLTTEDFIELGKSFKDGVPLAEKLADIVENNLAPAFETFSEVIQAATAKDFKEAFKGLELGDVGKKFKGELKGILEGMNDIARSGKAVATVISGLVVGALQGMSDKALGQGIKEITEQFNRFKSLDPDATIVQPLINFVNSLPTENKAAGILAVHQGLEDMAAAQATGNITTEKAMAIMGKYQPMIDKYNAAIAAGQSPTQALTTATQGLGTQAATTATQYDPLQTNILKTATAYDTLVNGIAKAVVTFPIPDISPFTTAILTISTGWDTLVNGIQGAKVTIPALIISEATGSIIKVAKAFDTLVNGINKAKPTINIINTNANKAILQTAKAFDTLVNGINKAKPQITINNSQAISAINKVVSAMNNVKNISRTITITTVYRTVGTKAAHNITTGIKAHNITGGGIGGLGTTETPIAALEGGGGMTMNPASTTAPSGGMGDVNITINMRDEFGIEKQRKFKAVLGKDRYIFGSVGAGG